MYNYNHVNLRIDISQHLLIKIVSYNRAEHFFLNMMQFIFQNIVQMAYTNSFSLPTTIYQCNIRLAWFFYFVRNLDNKMETCLYRPWQLFCLSIGNILL